ncbi:MAG: TetR/AcrR family transcriptional regulator [Pseudomonadota bacterium]
MNDFPPYHHGSLRAALIDAACDVVARQGHEALSLRSLADVLGVARSAPYRHFDDKNCLLVAVARRGFGQLTGQLNEIAATVASARERLIATGRAFLDFVQRNPQLFRLMYEASLSESGAPDALLSHAMADSYIVLERLYQRFAPQASPARSQLRMILLWSALYGYAKIRQCGILQPYMTSAVTDSEIEVGILDFMLTG